LVAGRRDVAAGGRGDAAAAARREDAAPPLILALESAGLAASVAVLRGDALLAEARAPAGRTGAESLLPCIDAALRDAGVALDALSAYAVSIGPGSFTGLRVGVATVKGLAFGDARPVLAVPTLAALALGAGAGDVPVVALLDARRGELYAAAWRFDAGGGPGVAALAEPPFEGVYTPEELAAALPEACVLVGEGLGACEARLRALVGPGVRLAGGAPRARDVGLLGLRLLADGETRSAGEIAPRYLRRAQAEVARTGRRFE
jgi:tRNA threonylcarbamoyladenosine biosynthesis protein TsaB